MRSKNIYKVGNRLNEAELIIRVVVIEECRILNVEIVDMKPNLVRALELLHPEMVESALVEYTAARNSYVVRAFVDALTKGGNIR